MTDCPDAPVSLIAGVPEERRPGRRHEHLERWTGGGGGAHLKAQPMFHGAAVVVNAVLVQLPSSCGEVRTRGRARRRPPPGGRRVDHRRRW